MEAAILERVSGRRNWLIETLEELVSHDSGTYDKEDVDRLGALLQKELQRIDLDVEVVRQAELGNHLVGRREPRNGKRLLLVGHFDTVWPHGAARERPFRIEAGRAYGPGVYDMKAGLVIMLAALDALREAGSPAFTETGITVVLNADEELLSPTSGQLITTEAGKAHTACVLEPARPGGEYTFVRKGAGRYFLRVTGHAAHAGLQPEKGISANLELAHKIIRLHALTDYTTGVTVNVGVIRGGTRANVVSPEAYAEIDLRAPTWDDVERTVQTMQKIAGESFIEGTSAAFWGKLDFPPLARKQVNERLFALVREAARVVGFEARELETGGGSDGNRTGQVTPTIDGMGARGDGAHSENEFIVIDSLVERAQVLALFLHRWTEQFEELFGPDGVVKRGDRLV